MSIESQEKKCQMLNSKIIFLDRDGILNVDNGYPHIWSESSPNPEAVKPLRIGIELGFNYIIVTNQSGIGRGYFNTHDYKIFMAELYKWYKHLGILFIDDFFCPHHHSSKNEIFSHNCICRKPKSGLIEQAFKKYSIDRQKSFLIGDKKSDIIAAQNANLRHATQIKSHINEVGPFSSEICKTIKLFEHFSTY